MIRRRQRHHGLTLIEVLLSMSILAMAMAALTQLQSNGVRAAQQAALQSEAVVICQSEMDAWLAGVNRSNALANTSSDLEIIPDQPRWARRVRITQAATGKQTEPLCLSLLAIDVYRVPTAATMLPSNAQPLASLSRWIDPAGYRSSSRTRAVTTQAPGPTNSVDSRGLATGGLP